MPSQARIALRLVLKAISMVFYSNIEQVISAPDAHRLGRKGRQILLEPTQKARHRAARAHTAQRASSTRHGEAMAYERNDHGGNQEAERWSSQRRPQSAADIK